MITLSQYINEYLIKKKIDKVRDNKTPILYTPKDKKELLKIICKLLKSGKTNLNCIDTSNITDMSDLFSDVENKKHIPVKDIDISEWNVSNVTNMFAMFYACEHFDSDLSNWDVSKVDNMHTMFADCKNFTGKGLENWNTAKLEILTNTFYNCYKLDCDLSNWDVSNVYEAKYTFTRCIKFDCDLSYWDVSNINNAVGMFYGCENLKGKGLENWNTKELRISNLMFYECKKLDCDLENWNLKKLVSAQDMLTLCTSLKKIPSWYL